jgi:hypothetical protein
MRRRFSVAVALACAALGVGATAAFAAPSTTVVMSGLDNPRGLTFGPNDALFVAEAGRGGTQPCGTTPEGAPAFIGSTGGVSRLRRGTQARIASGLPSLADGAGIAAIGPSDLDFSGRNGLLAIGLGGNPAGSASCPGSRGLASLAKIDANSGDVRPRDDIGAFETAFNPDRGAIDTNPHSLVKQENGTAIVADAGGNALLSITSRGEFTVLGTFPSRVNGRFTDAVPNSVAVGPDGAYYVGELTGAPFAAGAANVYRVAPPLAPQVWLTGFTTIIDLTFGKDGSLYVLQIGSAAGLSGPGALIRVAPNGTRTTILTDPLLFPTSVAIGRDGDAYVSNCGIFPGSGPYPCTGHVLKVDL